MVTKIYIHFPFAQGPGGGGASFLSNLSESFKDSGNLVSDADDADIILFNSHHDIDGLLALVKKFPQKYFVQRIDGPMSLYNNSQDLRDEMVKVASHFLADAYIFQSRWCQQQNDQLEITLNRPSAIIGNAVNAAVFSKKNKSSRQGKLKLISHSWSTNPNKGFSTLVWLDEHLDWSKFEMTFVGNTPCPFKNIKIISAKDRQALAALLLVNDVFIFPSRYEACSNALLEAQSIGLPVVAFNGSSNPEFVEIKELLFNEDRELPAILDKLNSRYEEIWAENSEGYKYNKMSVKAQQYLDFCGELLKSPKKKEVKILRARFLLYELKVFSKIKGGQKFINFRKDFLGGGASLNTVSNFFQAGVSISITIIMAHLLTKEKMALYPYFFSMQGLFSFLTIPGHDTMLNKAAIINDISFIKRAFRRMLKFTICGALFLSFALYISQHFNLYKLENSFIYYLIFASLPLCALERIEHTLLGFNQFKILFKYRFIFSCILFFSSVLTLFLTRNPMWVIISYMLSRFVQMLYGQLQLRRVISEIEKDKKVDFNKNLKIEGIRILFYNMASSIVTNFQPSFLYHLSPVELANFSNGTKFPDKIKDYAKIIISAPLQKWLSKGGKHFAQKMELYSVAFLLASMLFACLLAAAAPLYIPLVFGAQYTGAVFMAQLMSFTIPPRIAGSTFQQREIVLEDNKYYVYSGYIQLFINSLLIYPLVKTYHGVGICIVCLIQSYMSFFISFGRFCWWRKGNGVLK